ncbi:hypothetical protein ACQEVB_17780 [Pseudonocardia sp. CA-107938]|uniref:hypothetical protein n=1 Tax=Pseudonocardia sp. CA-107938 TaxID=3240021 RepID=UPI003D8A7A84
MKRRSRKLPTSRSPVGGNAVSIARHAAIAGVTGAVVVAVAVVLLAGGVHSSRPVAAADPTVGAQRPAPRTPTPTSAPARPGPATSTAAAPQVRSDDPRLGPYEQQAGCLRAGNAGMADGSWPDYECVGGAGSWRVVPARR